MKFEYPETLIYTTKELEDERNRLAEVKRNNSPGHVSINNFAVSYEELIATFPKHVSALNVSDLIKAVEKYDYEEEQRNKPVNKLKRIFD